MTLNNSAMRVEWDPSNRKETEEAKSKYIDARRRGRQIFLIDKERSAECFRETNGGFIIQAKELGETEFAARIFDENGDRRIIWDRNDPLQMKEASELFYDYIKRGWKCYGTDRHGNKSKRIQAFDPGKQEIIFDETSTSEKLEKFAKKFKSALSIPQKLQKFVETFKEVKLLPRTYPG